MTGEGNLYEGTVRDRPSPDRIKGMRVKTYVVMQRTYKRDPHRPNVKIIAVKLTEAAAQAVVDEVPGTWFERYYATKHGPRQ